MTKKNIILTSVLAAILAIIIIGISFDIAKAKTLTANLNLMTTSSASLVELGRVDVLSTRDLVLDSLNDHVLDGLNNRVALSHRVLELSQNRLLGGSRSLLNS